MFNPRNPLSQWQASDSCHTSVKALKNSFHKLWDFRTIPVRLKLAGVVIFFLSLLSFSSCSENKQTRASLLKDYYSFRDKTSIDKDSPASSIADYVIQWKTLENQLFDFIREDSLAYEENFQTISSMSFIGDSLTRKLNAVVDSRLFTYDDLTEIQTIIAKSYAQVHIQSPYVSEAAEFYNRLESELPPSYGITDTETEYLDFLIDASTRDYSRWTEVEECLRTEDLLYRGYISYVFEHSQSMALEIIETTHLLVERLSDSASSGKIETEKLLAYMTVRTNSRLIESAKAGINTTLSVPIYDISEASFCVSSYMAPFIHFHPNIIASRTERQKQLLRDIGHKIPDAFKTLESKDYILINAPDSLPNRILKDYVTFVLNN